MQEECQHAALLDLRLETMELRDGAERDPRQVPSPQSETCVIVHPSDQGVPRYSQMKELAHILLHL